MKTIKALKDLSFKDGSMVPKGTVIEFVRHGDLPTVGIWSINGVERKIRYRSIIKQPSIRALETWDNEGICNTVFGGRTEPDGYGEHGEPSWLLALGMI